MTHILLVKSFDYKQYIYIPRRLKGRTRTATRILSLAIIIRWNKRTKKNHLI